MKKNLFYLVAFFAFVTSSAFARDIHLRKAGTRDQSDRPRSNDPSVMADLTDNDLTIDVNRYAGNATVEITDANGTTWQTDTTYVYGHAQMTMNVSSLDCGNYTLVITLANGISYEGEFEIAD